MVFPRCSASTAANRSSVSSDLNTHPRTPASKQSRTTCSESTAVKIRMAWPGLWFRICRAASIQFWHADVQDKKIWFQLPALLDRIASVGGLSADLPSFVRSKQRTQTET